MRYCEYCGDRKKVAEFTALGDYPDHYSMVNEAIEVALEQLMRKSDELSESLKVNLRGLRAKLKAHHDKLMSAFVGSVGGREALESDVRMPSEVGIRSDETVRGLVSSVKRNTNKLMSASALGADLEELIRRLPRNSAIRMDAQGMHKRVMSINERVDSLMDDVNKFSEYFG